MADRCFGEPPSTFGDAENGGFISTRSAGWQDRGGVICSALWRVTGVTSRKRRARRRAGVGDLVQGEPGLGEFGKNRQQSRAGGRLQNEVGGGQGSGLCGGKAEGDRRRELLKAFGFLTASRLRRQPFASRLSMASMLWREPARARIALPNLSRNSTWAASEAS